MKNKKAYWSLIIISLIFAWLSWLMIFRTLYYGAKFYWSLPVASFYITLVLLGLYILVEPRKRKIYAVIALATLPAVLIMGNYWYLMLPVWLFSLLLIIFGVDRIRQEKSNRIRIIPHSLIRFGFPLITTAISLLISADYYLSVKDKAEVVGVPQVRVELPQPIIYASLDLVATLVPEESLRSISQGETVDEFLQAGIKESFTVDEADIDRYVSEQGGQVSEEQKQQIIQQVENFSASDNALALRQARLKLSKQVGQSLTGNEPMKQVMAAFINHRIGQFFNGEGGRDDILPLGMALALFLTIKALAWILGYPLGWTTTGIFHIMAKMGWLRVEKVQKEVEEIN